MFGPGTTLPKGSVYDDGREELGVETVTQPSPVGVGRAAETGTEGTQGHGDAEKA